LPKDDERGSLASGLGHHSDGEAASTRLNVMKGAVLGRCDGPRGKRSPVSRDERGFQWVEVKPWHREGELEEEGAESEAGTGR
jgi:hypothetical protein